MNPYYEHVAKLLEVPGALLPVRADSYLSLS